MQVFIRNANTLTFEIRSTDTIADVKFKYFERTGIPPQYIVLSYYGKYLNDNKEISEYNITKDTTIHMHVRTPVYLHN
jgi:hypothetical protein